MKKILLTLFVCCSALLAQAQQEQHFKFKGFDINGSIITFAGKLQNSGFKFIRANETEVVVRGTFAGEPDCSIAVYCSKPGADAESVSVVFSEKKTWNELLMQYVRFKQMLTNKYGEPSETIERFSGNFTTDEQLLKAVDKGNCHYKTTFTPEHGTIGLRIVESRQLEIVYLDDINAAKSAPAAAPAAPNPADDL